MVELRSLKVYPFIIQPSLLLHRVVGNGVCNVDARHLEGGVTSNFAKTYST